MSLRTRLLGLFALLAILPLVGLGVFDYARSVRALESLIAAQVAMFAERTAAELTDRYAIVDANVSLLAENEEARRLYEMRALAPTGREFFNGVWSELGRELAWVAYQDTSGHTLLQLGDRSTGLATREYVLHRNVVDGEGRVIGTVDVAARLDSVLPQGALAARIGQGGRSLVVDRSTGDILYDTRHDAQGGSATVLLAGLRRWLSQPAGAATRGTFNVQDGDSTRMAAVVTLAAPPVAILAAGTLEEFSGPFASILRSNVSVLIVLLLVLSTAFVVSLRRATRTLSALTFAADEVGRGNLQPTLPIVGSRDEVGRLTAAFDSMLARLRAMLYELERSQQLAAVGQFASQIAHEIRNPLTAIKLNLQRLDRATHDDGSAHARPVAIALRETLRLDRVVRGVLQLGRPGRVERAPVDVHAVIHTTVERHRDELDAQGVVVELLLGAQRSIAAADRPLLESALANLLLNAAEADASEIAVATSDGDDALRITITDNGHGLSPETAARLFEPFYTTKPEGTGLGLALVRRTIEDHGGTVVLRNRGDGATGTRVVILLPIADQSTS